MNDVAVSMLRLPYLRSAYDQVGGPLPFPLSLSFSPLSLPFPFPLPRPSVFILKLFGPCRLTAPSEVPIRKLWTLREAAMTFVELRIDNPTIINAATIEIAKILATVVWFIILH